MTNDVIKKLEKMYKAAVAELRDVKTRNEVEALRHKYLGRKGGLNTLFKSLDHLKAKQKRAVGARANEVKAKLGKDFQKIMHDLRDKDGRVDFDETIQGVGVARGTLHPLTQFIQKITAVFTAMGFEIVEDREVETAEYNFDKLNIPPHHPARDLWDTFYVNRANNGEDQGQKDETETPLVLRTHTSPVQLRAMETRKPPVRLVVPGRCYRHEATDASHEVNFYQLEGLVIDKGISVANMIHTLDSVLKAIFGATIKTRIRPSFFPFVEPGHEVDMSCIICDAKGCSVCGRTGWLEMLGSGLVHPTVLKNMNVDENEYSGFAFGMGIDRLMMLYYGIDDVRLSYSGDLRFLKQF